MTVIDILSVNSFYQLNVYRKYRPELNVKINICRRIITILHRALFNNNQKVIIR